MAKNESLAVLHATLDFRRIIDVPGYDRIMLSPCTRFIATMNYGYAGTRELNEALASRFMVITMPVISGDNLQKLLREQFPALRPDYAEQLAGLFEDIRRKCDSSEISTKPLDLRGLLAAVTLVEKGLSLGQALELGLVNKSFDAFERQLVGDLIAARLPGSLTAAELFGEK
jgi:MoxR-like ATPase